MPARYFKKTDHAVPASSLVFAYPAISGTIKVKRLSFINGPVVGGHLQSVPTSVQLVLGGVIIDMVKIANNPNAGTVNTPLSNFGGQADFYFPQGFELGKNVGIRINNSNPGPLSTTMMIDGELG